MTICKSVTSLVLKGNNSINIITDDPVLLEMYKNWTVADALSDEELDSGIITSKWTLAWYARCEELFGKMITKPDLHTKDYNTYDILDDIERITAEAATIGNDDEMIDF